MLVNAFRSRNKATVIYLLDNIHIQFPTERNGRARFLRELISSGLIDIFKRFYTEADTTEFLLMGNRSKASYANQMREPFAS